MTMPSLITNYQKKQTLKQLRASYTTLAQVFERAKVEYGDIDTWILNDLQGQSTSINSTKLTETIVQTYFLPYISYTKDHGTTTFEDIGITIKGLDNEKATDGYYIGKYYIVELVNGNIIGFRMDTGCKGGYDSEGNCNNPVYTSLAFTVDINGYKKPNTLGKDIFCMRMQDNKFEFYVNSGIKNNRTSLLRNCSKEYTKENRQCGRLIEYDGWEINYDW